MSDCNHDVKQKMCQMGKCKPTPGALTREQVEDHCNMLADANVDWPGRESLSEALLDHDAALRATITQQAQESAESERKLREVGMALVQALIQIHDLKKELAALQQRGNPDAQPLA